MDNYIVYSLLGKVTKDDLKLSRWVNWEPCFILFDDILSPYSKTARIKSYQIYEIPLKKPVGNVTYRKVPKFSALKWTYQQNQLWSEYSYQNEPYKVRHIETTIVSSKGAEPPDICIFLYDDTPACFPEYLYNQELTISIREKIHISRPSEYWDKMIDSLIILFHAVRVGRTKRLWRVERLPPKLPHTLERPFFAKGVTTSLDFYEGLQTWEYIK